MLVALTTTACGGVGQPATYDATGIDGLEVPTPAPDPADFVAEVDNPWFPLPVGTTRRYVLEQDGETVGAVRVEVLAGSSLAGLPTTQVRTRTRVDGADPSTVVRWYAQDEAGNVWLVGEDGWPSAGDAWRAGEAGAEAGLAMPAEPRVGDGWLRARVPGGGEQVVRVDAPPADGAVAVTEDAVWTLEDDGSERTRDVYARGLGLVESVVLESATPESDGGSTVGRTTSLLQQPG